MLQHAIYTKNKGYIYSSDEISKEELNELKSYFDYDNINISETYTYIKLNSNRYAFVKSFYQDENIFHAVILEKLELSPHEYIYQNIFINSLDDIDSLPTTIENIKTLHDGDEFLKKRQDRSIKDIVNILMKKDTKILIVDKNINIFEWINSIFYCFPKNVSKNITFTTNPYFKVDVRLFVLDTDVQIQGAYIFDFIRNFKPAISSANQYTRFIDTGIYTSKQIYKSFMNFMGYFKYSNLDEELNYSYSLFILLNIPNMLTDLNQIKSAIAFMTKYIKEEERQAFIETYINTFDYLTDKITLDIADDLYSFLFKEVEHKKGVYDKIVNIFYRSLFNILKNEHRLDKLIELYDKVSDQNKEKLFFFTYVLDKTWFKFIEDFIDTPEAYKLNLYISIKSAIVSGFSFENLKKLDGFKETFIKGICEEILGNILNVVELDLDFYLDFALDAFETLGSRTILNDIYIKYKDNIDDIKRKIYKRILDKKLYPLALEIYLKGLDEAEDKIKYFGDYRQNILEYFEEYSKEYLDNIVIEYFKSLDKQERFEESKKLLNDYVINSIYILNLNAASVIIETFELGITLENYVEHKDLIEKVKEIKAKKEIKTNIDMSFLDVIYILDDFSGDNFELLLDDIKYIMREYRIETSMKHRAIILYKVIKYLNNFEYHKSIFDMFYEEEDVLTYFEFIKANRNQPNYKDILSSFIVFYLYYIEPKFRLLQREDKNSEIEESIITEITSLKKENIPYFDEKIKATFKNLNLSIPVKWSIILNKINERMTFKYKLKTLFMGK